MYYALSYHPTPPPLPVDLDRYHFTFDPRKKGLRKILGDLEADVMEAIWACGRATVHDVHARLAAADRALAYTTVTTVMSRLAEKGLVGLTRLPPLHRHADAGPLAFTTGCVRPAVFLAPAVVGSLGADELRAVLVHELVHVRRRDTLRAWLGSLLPVGALGVLLQVAAAVLWTSLFLWTYHDTNHGSDRRVERPETVHTFYPTPR